MTTIGELAIESGPHFARDDTASASPERRRGWCTAEADITLSAVADQVRSGGYIIA